MANVNSLRGEERREREEEGGEERREKERRTERREGERKAERKGGKELSTLTLQQYLGDGEERIPPYWGP